VSPTRHIIGHLGDESFQEITCIGTKKDTKQTKYSNPIYNKHTQENIKDTKNPYKHFA